ncbi:MAG: PDZ domain-containing protein, partial [Elusimicrobiota bacterium]
MPRRILAAAVSIFILFPASSGPLLAQTVSQSVSAGAGRGVAPIPGSMGFGSGPGTVAPGLSTLAGPSLPSALIAAPRYQTRAGASAAAPFTAPAVPARVNASFSGPAAPVGVPGLREAAPAQKDSRASAASAEVEETSRGVSEAVEEAGPAEKAASETAHGLGRFLMRLLTGAKEAAGSGSVEASVRSQANAPRKTKVRSRKAAATAKGAAAKLAASVSPAQKKMLQALEHVASLYTEHYAPIEWKQKQLGVDFKKEYQKARASILAKPGINAREFQDILAAFVYATRDYHVSIQFYSTEKARLPLLILEAEGRYYIASIDRSKLSASEFPFEIGDEVVEFGGKPTEAVVSELAGKRPGNVPTTDRRIAQLHLTNRIRQAGESVPQGPVTLKIRDKAGSLREAALRWDYTPESVPSDAPVREGGLSPESVDGLPGEVPSPGAQARGIKGFISRLLPSMAHPLAGLFSKRAKQEANGFMIGARESFVPDLGEILWEISKASPIRAYIYKDERG